MEEDIFAGIAFPTPIEMVFDNVISIGWYDGTTSGLAVHSSSLLAFRFDLLAWGPSQEVRVFVLSPIAIQGFEQVVKLFSRFEPPQSPIWYPGWPSETQRKSQLESELDSILKQANNAEFVFASQSRFETILAAKRLTQSSRTFVPHEFDAYGAGNFDYWQGFLELPV